VEAALILTGSLILLCLSYTGVILFCVWMRARAEQREFRDPMQNVVGDLPNTADFTKFHAHGVGDE